MSPNHCYMQLYSVQTKTAYFADFAIKFTKKCMKTNYRKPLNMFNLNVKEEVMYIVI